MHFYTVEVFQPFLERLLPGVSCEDIFKVTVISDNYKFDIEAHHAVQDVIYEILTDDEQELIAIEFNEDFFPMSLCYDEDLEEELDEDTSTAKLLEEFPDDEPYEISFDGLPRIERDMTIQDYIQSSYTLGDREMEALQVRINIMISPDEAEYMNFETNTTVH